MLHQRYVLLAFALAAVIAVTSVKAASVSVFEYMAIIDTRMLGFIELSTLVSIGAGVFVFAGLIRSQAAVTYVDEVVDELHKVTWPSREDTLKAASTVVGTTLFVATLVAIYDFVWHALAQQFLFVRG